MLINPFLRFRMSLGWLDGSHRNNPAIDYATPVGFVFGAPGAGIYRHLRSNLSRTDTSAAGHHGELQLTEGPYKGYRIRFCHLDRHVAGNSTRVAPLDVLAATGNTGYVQPAPTRAQPHLGAHVHTYGLTPSGARWDWTQHATAPAPAGGDGTPLEDEMSADAERKIDELYQALMPGKAGVRTQGPVNKMISDTLEAVRGIESPTAAEVAGAVWSTPVKRGGKNISALQELADAKTHAAEAAKGITAAQVQVIADEIAKHIGSTLRVDAAAIAKAVNDDAAARMKS